MANQKDSALPTISGASLADGDLFRLVDVSDTTDGPAGSSKVITKDELSSVMGGGSGVTPETVYEALLPLGKIAPDFTTWGAGEYNALYSPNSDEATDGAWMVFGFKPNNAELILGWGDTDDPNLVICDLQSSDGQGYMALWEWTGTGNTTFNITPDTNGARLTLQASAIQTGPLLTCKDTGGGEVFSVEPDGKIGFHGHAAAAQSVAGTTAADAIACLQAHGLMAT